MATKQKGRGNGTLNNIALSIKNNIDKLYTNTYFTQPTNSRDLANLKKDISNSINSITTNNLDNVGTSLSKMYSKLGSMNGDSDLRKSMENIFGDQANLDGIMQAYQENKWLKDLDNEIDSICKYMPKLLEALDTRKDNVLSADHFSKDFISVPNSSTINNSTFSERVEAIKTKYDLLTEVDTWYDNAAKYGEQFLYIVPYKQALKRLQQNKSTAFGASVLSESGNIKILENSAGISTKRAVRSSTDFQFNIEINTSGIIESVINNREIASNKMNTISEQSVCLEFNKLIMEQAYAEAGKEIGLDGIPGDPAKDIDSNLTGKKHKLDNILKAEDLEIPDNISQDGLFKPIKNNPFQDDKDNKLNVPGCIIKKLDRTLVKPIYMEDMCMGYCYAEVKDGDSTLFNNGSILDPTNMSRHNMAKNSAMEQNAKQDEMLRNMASQVSAFIDDKFINNNIDLAKEIYMILKYNDIYNRPGSSIKITFIAPEDMVHIRFKEDPKTHRGISDLERALFPAKLYTCLYLTNAIASMTRSFDKRVYYVKQTIDNNIAKTLLTTLNQIKKSNFGLRQIENINNVLNITGAFNDYLIPTNGSNEPPINFEVMQGQQINMPTELMDSLEEMAVNSTDVPIELIQARQSMDYAVQYTMTNSKFLRKVYNRQGKYQNFLAVIISKIYNYEYNENVDLKVALPPPVFLNITNTSQIITNTSDFANGIVEIRMGAETNDKKKAIFAKKVKEYYLGSYLDTTMLDKFEDEAAQESSIDPEDE